MKVQAIDTMKGERYILLNDLYEPVDEVNRFLKYLDITGKSPNTLKNYAFHLKIFYEYMNSININVKSLCNCPNKGPIDILSDFMVYLQYPAYHNGIINITGETAMRGDSTVNIIIGTVLSFYQFLSKNKELEEIDLYKMQRSNPQFKSFLYELVHKKSEIQKSLLRKKVVSKDIEYVTRAQFNELFFACNLERDRLLLALLFECGLRINEALGIRLEDIAYLEDNILDIVPRENNENGARVKNHAAGTVYLPPYIVDMILDYINTVILEFDSDYLFLNLSGPNVGKPMKAITVTKLFERLSSNVGYRVTPHMLRHGFATEKLEHGWEMEDISVYLRHKTLQSTQIYAHYSDNLKKEKMRDYLQTDYLSYGGILND